MLLTYLRFLLGTVLLVLASTSTLNFVADPAGIYRDGRLNPQSYADALIKSEHGLWNPADTIDDRLLAKAMTKYGPRVECVVIGSSHVMQISSERMPKSLNGICGSIINLGVSGGGIEDHFVMTYLVLKHGQPKKIILGVDPWTFSFSEDQSWSTYRDDYFQARTEILGLRKAGADRSNSIIDAVVMSKLANLINLEYTIRSVQAAVRNYRWGPPTITAAPQLDASVGGEYPIRLRDNSTIYAATYIADPNRAIVPLGGTTYKTNGKLNRPDTIDAYRGLLLWIRSKGVEPILLMTPYHENVLKAPSAPNTVAIFATEPLILNLARELDIKVIGSYQPKIVGCLPGEFYDFMHPTADCLTKLQVRLSVPSASQN